jgi:hypothetical protein
MMEAKGIENVFNKEQKAFKILKKNVHSGIAAYKIKTRIRKEFQYLIF